MKYKFRTYANSNIRDWFIQCTLLPSITITHNKQEFIETCVYGKSFGISFEFLFWDCGIFMYEDYE
jgi:hypothetical protein